jgi:hypothetical protein
MDSNLVTILKPFNPTRGLLSTLFKTACFLVFKYLKAMHPSSSMKNEISSRSSRFPQHYKAPQHVGFGKVHIFEFPTTVGDNPACSKGVPVTLGMTAKSSMDVDIDFYELCYPSALRRGTREIRLSVPERVARYANS